MTWFLSGTRYKTSFLVTRMSTADLREWALSLKTVALSLKSSGGMILKPRVSGGHNSKIVNTWTLPCFRSSPQEWCALWHPPTVTTALKGLLRTHPEKQDIGTESGGPRPCSVLLELRHGAKVLHQ